MSTIDSLRRDAPVSMDRGLEQTPASPVSSDGADIAASLRGDGDAFARLVERHQQAVGRLMQRFARDRATREMLVQDTFVEAWQSLAGYRGDAPFLHWLRVLGTRVGYRHWLELARRRPTAARGDDADTLAQIEAPPDTSLQAREAADIVHALLARLSPRDRLVLTLLHLEGCTGAEIAALTGWSRVMVKVQAHRARRRLAALLPPEPPRTGRAR